MHLLCKTLLRIHNLFVRKYVGKHIWLWGLMYTLTVLCITTKVIWGNEDLLVKTCQSSLVTIPKYIIKSATATVYYTLDFVRYSSRTMYEFSNFVLKLQRHQHCFNKIQTTLFAFSTIRLLPKVSLSIYHHVTNIIPLLRVLIIICAYSYN